MEEPKNKKKLMIIGISFYIIIYYMFIIFFKSQSLYSMKVEALLEIVPLLIASTVILKLAVVKGKKSIFLYSLLIVTLTNFIGRCFDIYCKVSLKTQMDNYMMLDIISVIGSLLFFVVLIYKFYKKVDKRTTIVLTIDVLTIMCVAIALVWIYNISPHIDTLTKVDLLEIGLYISYPIIHLGILSISIILHQSMSDNDMERKSILIIILAFMLMYMSNLAYAYILSSDSHSKSYIVKPMWGLYDLLIMIAAIEYSKAKNIEKNKDEIIDKSSLISRGVFPGLSTILLFILVTIKRDELVWVCFGTSIILINIRQVITNIQKKSLIVQLENLSKELEIKVEERTKEIYEIESTDDLTGLINRRRFESIATIMMEESKKDNASMSVMLIDLDRFKIINDNYGHSFGDLLIREFADILNSLVDEKSVVSRQGGDEFAIVTKDVVDSDYPKELSEKILKKLISPIILNDQKIYVTCSIGISIYPRDGDTYENIIRCADVAMYNSKSIGRNTYSFYEEDMVKSNSKRITLERELHKAVEKSEFILHYQPQVDILKNEVIGLEALIRWNHPTQGMISPFHFIPIAEETGLIGVIGEWVLRTACVEMKRLHEKGYDKLKIGVNISAYQFQQENFVDMVRNVLIETKLKPAYLDLEITESIPMENEINVITKLKKLKRLGVQVSMDDFGTGYSSLSYLRRLPIDTLKIPREFIIEIKPYYDKKNIIEAIIAIAQKLELSIIAEGVENEIQLEFLKSKNCSLIQGYIFSKPLPGQDIEAFLDKEL